MSELPTLISRAAKVTCISHVHPDGDAVGSIVGLGLALQGLGKQVDLVLVDGVPPIFRYLNGTDSVRTSLAEDPGLCLVLDCSDLLRTGQLIPLKRAAARNQLGCIDHHPKGDIAGIAACLVHRPEASSTSEIVYDLIMELGAKITPDIATALLTGIYTDTGGFQFPNTTNRTLEISADLMRRGGKLQKIVQEVSHSKSLAALRLLGIALERMRITEQGTCAISALTHADIAAAGAQEDDLAGIVNSLNVLPEILFSVLLTEVEPGKIRGTLRAGERHSVNVGKIAKLLGGGGHPRAAGFVTRGSIIGTGSGWAVVAPSE